ncbi:MAG: hypothetical protein COA73_01105 [Candidatus Hydrogenedentota bacterium]|nr:MAG: hypothetical protein COA73_01105 [Candidatus Hydrogenedentota bacterium]
MDAISSINQISASGDVALQGTRRAKAFESLEEMFLSILFKEMRKSIPDGGIMEKSHATKVYEEMLDETFAAQMAKSGQLGIAKQLSEQWRVQQLQESMQSDALANNTKVLESL